MVVFVDVDLIRLLVEHRGFPLVWLVIALGRWGVMKVVVLEEHFGCPWG